MSTITSTIGRVLGKLGDFILTLPSRENDLHNIIYIYLRLKLKGMKIKYQGNKKNAIDFIIEKNLRRYGLEVKLIKKNKIPSMDRVIGQCVRYKQTLQLMSIFLLFVCSNREMDITSRLEPYLSILQNSSIHPIVVYVC